MDKNINYYDVLGVSPKSTLDDIKKAFRRLARKYHPDVNPGDKNAEERFKDVNEAYDVLGDVDSRAKYDEKAGKGTTSNVASDSSNIGNATNSPSSQEAEVAPDIIDLSMFPGFDAFVESRIKENVNPQSKNESLGPIVISARDAFNGTVVEFNRNGSVRKMRIPAGIPPGGDSILFDGVNVPLVVNFVGTLYRMGQSGLEYTLPISIDEVKKGGKLNNVPTPWGPVTLTIPAPQDLGNILRFKGRGWPEKTNSTKLTTVESATLGLQNGKKAFWLSLPQLKQCGRVGNLYIRTELVPEVDPRCDWDRYVWKLEA